MSVRILCINDADKPVEIPKKKWVVKDEEYTLIFIAFCHPQKCQGFGLAEIELDETCHPYEYYKASRFAIRAEDLEEFLQLAKDCTDLDDFSLEDLLEETKIEVIENV